MLSYEEHSWLTTLIQEYKDVNSYFINLKISEEKKKTFMILHDLPHWYMYIDILKGVKFFFYEIV